MYGTEPSESGRYDRVFSAPVSRDVAELGAGQGRDTLAFLKSGMSVTVLDYAPTPAAAALSRSSASPSSNGCRQAQRESDRATMPISGYDPRFGEEYECLAYVPDPLPADLDLAGETYAASVQP